MDVWEIVGVYIIPFVLVGFFFMSMYMDVEHVDRHLSEEMRNKLKLKKDSFFRKLLPKRQDNRYIRAQTEIDDNKDGYMYHRVIPFFIYLIATIIIWILATINFFIVEFMTKQAYYNIYFTMLALAIFYDVATLICLYHK